MTTGTLETSMRSLARFLGAYALLAALAAPAGAAAQHDPRVPVAEVYAIRGGTVHTLAGEEIAGGTVVVRGGVIEAVGRDVAVPAGAAVVDASGLHVYPGMIDAFSQLGLTEIGSVDVMQDVDELGEFNPHLTTATAIHPASEHIPVARANGVTHTLAAPTARGGNAGIPGRAALVHLDGWTVEEMAVQPSAAMVLHWPALQTRTFDRATFQVREKPFTEAKKEHEKQVRLLDEWFEAAAHYRQAVERAPAGRVTRDLQLEHLARTLGGELPVIVVASDRRSIEGALDFAERHGLRMVLGRGRDARAVKETLAERGIPVILGPTQVLPGEEDDPYHAPFSLAGELRAAGVKVAFATFGSANSRTLPYEAANAVPFGLSREEALRAVTVYPAEILGVADRLGTIEPGKIGNLIVTSGDPLEIRTAVEYVFIGGRPVDLMNRHRKLYEQHRARPAPR